MQYLSPYEMRLRVRTPKTFLLLMAFLQLTPTLRGDPSATNSTVRLASELAALELHELSAAEFERASLQANVPEHQGALYWAAAYEYWKAEMPSQSQELLDKAEDLNAGITAPSLLLRAECARDSGAYEEADFFYLSAAGADTPASFKEYTCRRLASLRLERNRAIEAIEVLGDSPDASERREIIRRAAAQPRKRPWLGGLLGMVPGLGYAYSGEYANGLRSLILNGLFIYAMIDTAGDEHWGGFAALSFFELTWYSGSIYGGIDAAHRHNHGIIEDAVRDIESGASFSADLKTLPVVSLRFEL